MTTQNLESNENRKSYYSDRGKFIEGITVQELVTALREFAKTLTITHVQKEGFPNALEKLANFLSRHKDKPINDVLDNLTIGKQRRQSKWIIKTSKTISESEAKDFTLEHIERLLESERLSKPDLITIAVGKFGIPKADLMKTRKELVVEAIRTAIGNLRTIEIIGKQASGRD